MDQISNLKIKLTAETAKFTEEINRARNSLGKLSGASRGINLTKVAIGGLAVAATAAAAAFATLSSMASQGLSIYAETERYMARTEAQLRATGAAVGFTTNEMDRFAREVAMNTLASTNGVRNAMSIMLTFKSVTGDTFKEAIKLSQDLAEVFNTDVSTEARNLGRALESPAEAASILKRKGIELSDTQQELINKFVELGEKAKAQEIILHALQERVGGAGEAAAKDTLTGALDSLDQATEELKEEFAKATGITDVFRKSVNWLTEALQGLKKAMQGPTLEEHISTLEKELDVLEKGRKVLEERINASGVDDDGVLQSTDDNLASTRKKLEEARAKLAEQQKQAEIEAEKEKKLKEKQEIEEKQKAGAISLKELNQRLATRREKLNAQYEKDQQMLKNLVLSQEQIEAQGFENIEQLRSSHLAKLTQQYNANLAEIEKSESKKTKTSKLAAQDQLSTLDLRYATEAQKIELNHQLQIKKIQQMAISEKQARQKGFASALELRKHYFALENAAYQEAMDQYNAKIIQEQKDKERKVRSFFNEIRGSGNNPYEQSDIVRDEQLEKAKEMHEKLILSTQEFEQAKAEIEDAYRKRKEDLDRQAAMSQLSAAASLFDGLAGLMEATAGRNSTAYRTMFAISKSFQIAESMLHLQAAIMKAMNDPTAITPAQKFANMAAVASAGANVLNQLTSITLAGARAKGGPVGGGRAYLVGEKGPEIFVPGASGQITSNENLNKALGGGSGGNVVVYQTNNFDSSNADNRQLAKMIAKATEAKVYEVWQKEKRSGGKF